MKELIIHSKTDPFVLEEGFTIVEILVALTITVLASVGIFSILIQNNDLSIKQSNNAILGVSLNNAVSEINTSILQAASISLTCPSPTPCPQSFTSSATTLVLKLPYLDSSGTLIDTKNDYAVITQDATNPNILRKYVYLYDAGSGRKSENKVLATSLSLLAFRYLDSSNPPQDVAPASATKINFVINLKGTGLTPSISSASGQVNLRNN